MEDGLTGSQLVHILQLVVEHHKVYYPVRHHLMQHIGASIQQLGFTATALAEDPPSEARELAAREHRQRGQLHVRPAPPPHRLRPR